jgi:hypothetical protein
METGSDSGHTTGDHYAMDYHARYKLGYATDHHHHHARIGPVDLFRDN